MKKILFFLILVFIANNTFGQTPTLQQKLYYTSKVWGFVKYYHSNVSTCHVNWDSVLVSTLPIIRSAATDSAFNDALDTMLAAAGPMILSTTYFPDTLAPALKRNRDWSWISSPILRSDVQTQLDTIKNNFRPHANCWVEVNLAGSTGYLLFPFDSLELNINTYVTYPDMDHRQLMLFKYWNIIRYFNPYNYVLDVPWDSTLYHYVLRFDSVSNSQSLFSLVLNIGSTLNDAHVYDLNYSYEYQSPPGFYRPQIRLSYIEGKYVVVKSAEIGIYPGDAIVSIDGLTTSQWEDSLGQFISAGNLSVFRRNMYEFMLGRVTYNGHETLVVEDSTGTDHTYTVTCSSSVATEYSFYLGPYYPVDSIDSISWTTMPCNVGYVNMGNLQVADENAMYTDLRDKDAIIFDFRNYPNGTGRDIANLIYPNPVQVDITMDPDVTYPGTYFYYNDIVGLGGNPTPYTGKIILLMNEITQSQSEGDCMILGALPGTIKIGSQTAGTDGDVVFWKLSQDLSTGFTSKGVFYPNGDSTERIGIVPDSVVYPTRAGIRHKNDEVLDKALQVACTASSTQQLNIDKVTVKVFPNPASDAVTIRGINLHGQITINITDITGRILIQKVINSGGDFSSSFDIRSLSIGMYFAEVKTDTKRYVMKIIKNDIE